MSLSWVDKFNNQKTHMNTLKFDLTEMRAMGDLIAALNRNGIPYEVRKNPDGFTLEIGRGF